MAGLVSKADRRAPVPISGKDQRGARRLYEALRRGKARLAGPDGNGRQLPDSLAAFLIDLIGVLEKGKCVYILQNQARLTTAEAAGILGVSRQFLVNLLKSGEIPHHMVGTHRRIYAQDLLRYKAKRDGRRRRILEDLVEAEVGEGLYEKVPARE